MDREGVARWVGAYERAWRTPGTAGLGELFGERVRYVVSPWAKPIVGLEALAAFWEAGRSGADEPFRMMSEVVAVEGGTAVVRVFVEYENDDPGRWRDLWVVRFDGMGRCVWFEEWPFAPDQWDGQERVGGVG
ncbi:nuclear transport factor 2 family protein [Nocardia crassostreae]|uniref:nuclear transport factor 2 family protein n=1 Tax=Nocardia crassostreae TaxID=53428 RepID=UPI0008355DBC|nr:nuclear transport factor 2 family protein [Nocardia crassostreae]